MYFQRFKSKDLERWKNNENRLPMIIKGARQTGKTFLVNEFGKNFSNFFELNFQKDKLIHDFFISDNRPSKIVEKLEIYLKKKINMTEDLIFFDEIQDCPEALNSLKYFAEEYPQSCIIGAGSLLGLYLSQHTFPVGKVQFETLYPMSFAEYLQAKNESNLALALHNFDSSKIEDIKLINSFHGYLLDLLKEFFIVGGMPKVVSTFLETKNVLSAREVQLALLTSYQADFAKFSGPLDALKIFSVFENIPKQLAKDNRKFQFNLLKKGSRYNEFSSCIDWLTAAGLVYKVPILNHVEIPLKTCQQENIFKLYLFDVGLLGALSELPLEAFMYEGSLFKTFKGAFSENFFLQEFRSNRSESFYSWLGKTSEIDFLFQDEIKMNFWPIEVKSGESGKLKSLNVFCEIYSLMWKTRCSARALEINEQAQFRNFPLYLAGKV
ncbi:MAG: hypothetical protein A2381_00825 [Bdellovibrionales bacterium RIFOXYB1_FULL_37_110]|nr:MAG: hypothetical protein A2417_01680 [Bdellovibrionales bacterium RIFOXYC1_FULL_37_79]OFZ58763.1 MAG: hypothetical protein A2381_00825 [Bdellovibrionales bacterium RIFOXYB1_FULL_37_110]OFZ64762.1 MAG: hypothetical protein A2577_06825 [Bdellovibrionales bacterium RIFOXYD1_FULL_36_51]